MSWSRILVEFASFRVVLAVSCVLRIGLILYSEWHDAHSVMKYTDVDYRVFTDATRFLLSPGPGNRAQGPLGHWLNVGDPYTRATYRYTPLLAVLLAPNEWIHPSFGKYVFAACDIVAGAIIHSLLLTAIFPLQYAASDSASKAIGPSVEKIGQDTQTDRKVCAAMLAGSHLLSPFVFSISTRGSSESVLLLFILGTLACALHGRWIAAAVLLGLSAHWKIYPVIYGVSCLAAICQERAQAKGKTGPRALLDEVCSREAVSFTAISSGTFFALGAAMFTVWGQPFLDETYLYHLHRRDHRHNFAPHFYLIYLAYPGTDAEAGAEGGLPPWRALIRSPLASFVPQLVLAVGTGALLARRRANLVIAWFAQTAAFVIFNKVCTSQYFLWYLAFVPLLAPSLHMSARKAGACVSVWAVAQALWLSQAYRLEFLGEEVFAELWVCGLVYLLGHAWVLGVIVDAYDGTLRR